MKRCRAAFVGCIRVRAAVEQDFHDGEIPRADGLMKRCDRVTVPGIDGRASLDEQPRWAFATARRSPRYTDVTTEIVGPAPRRSSTISCRRRAAA